MTAIYVTHDQEEALAISDRIAIMAKGKIEQLDQPERLYSHPQSFFAATFIGNSNQFDGIVTSATEGVCKVGDYAISTSPLAHLQNGSHIHIIVRPEEVSLLPASSVEPLPTASSTKDNHIAGVIELRTFLGPFTRFHIRANDHTTLSADIPNHLAKSFEIGQHVLLSFAPNACHVFPDDAHGTAPQMRVAELTQT